MILNCTFTPIYLNVNVYYNIASIKCEALKQIWFCIWFKEIFNSLKICIASFIFCRLNTVKFVKEMVFLKRWQKYKTDVIYLYLYHYCNLIVGNYVYFNFSRFTKVYILSLCDFSKMGVTIFRQIYFIIFKYKKHSYS